MQDKHKSLFVKAQSGLCGGAPSQQVQDWLVIDIWGAILEKTLKRKCLFIELGKASRLIKVDHQYLVLLGSKVIN